MFKKSVHSCKALYSLLSLQDKMRQRQEYEEVQHILANPTNTKCKGTWVAKRKQEDEDTYIRNVKARLESINKSLSENADSMKSCMQNLRLLKALKS